MHALIVFLITILSLVFTVSWILPRIIAWLFERKYKIALRIGRIGFKLKLFDISITKNGFAIHIDEIGITSSFLNSELTKLVTLVVKDVRINNQGADLNSSASAGSANGAVSAGVVDFRDKKVPHFITTFAQFMAVHIYNVSAMLLRSDQPHFLVHATAGELHLDGSILKNARSLLVTANLMDASVKVLKHADRQSQEGSTCLAEFSFAIGMETILVAQGPLSVEKLFLKMSNTSATISEGFYCLVQASSNRGRHRPTTQLDDFIVEKVAPIIPKNCSLHIDDTNLKSVRETNQIDYNATLRTLSLNYRTLLDDSSHATTTSLATPSLTSSTYVRLNCYMDNLQLLNSQGKLFEMKNINVEAKLKNYTVNVFLQLNALLVVYNHEIIHRWVYANFLKNQVDGAAMKLSQQQQSPFLATNSSNSGNKISSGGATYLEKLLRKLTINLCAEFAQVLSIVKLGDGHDSHIGFKRLRFMVEQTQLIEINEKVAPPQYASHLANVLLGDRGRSWQMELLVESLWCSFKEWSDDLNVSKSVHVWGSPLYLGMGLIKVGSEAKGAARPIKIVTLLDTVQWEWSLDLADYVLLAIKCFKQYKVGRSGSLKEESERLVDRKMGNVDMISTNFEVNVVLKHFNCFLQSQNNEFFVCRLNQIEFDQTQQSQKLTFEEVKLFSLQNTGSYYTCIRTEDISNYKIFIKTLELIKSVKKSAPEVHVNFLKTFTIYWSTNFHLKCLLLVRDICDFWHGLRDEFDTSVKSDSSQNFTGVYSLLISGQFDFNIDIYCNGDQSGHKLNISLGDLKVRNSFGNSADFNLATPSVHISIDGDDIFHFGGLDIRRVHDSELIRAERLDAESFQLEWNTSAVWGVTVDLFKAVFPYEHNFAEAVQNQFMSVVKWLKLVHGYRKRAFTADSPLPADLFIVVKEFVFEMSDDPFEVKLRDNYELLVDEYHESLKRQKMLKEKVAELCKTHLHLPAGKVEELYANLKKKNADIYVHRSKMMLKASPARTRLFAWTMTNVEVMALADPTIHGAENVVRALRDMDPKSPWPADDACAAPMEFSTLWCRVVSLRCAEWKFQLRDFPQPLLLIRQCYICGQLAGAEQLAPPRATRTVSVELGEPFDPCTIERGMLPLKFYHDFNCEVETYSYAFGPCWEPVIAQCNLSFNKISAPSRDPSLPLSFWDKMRLLLHGRLTMLVQQLTINLHASLDPYNTTEEMALTWERVAMDWTNCKFVYKGDLNIFVRTASKYDDVQLLKLPDLKLVLDIEWVCIGNPHDHHSVVNCAPDKIPEYSSNQVHDSFRAFRSQHVNLSVSLETRPGAPQSHWPILLLYGSTLRWIESLKLILSGVTRPTRRGRVFRNVQPRKIQLSRHYKTVRLHMGLHRFQVCYWMSFAMQRGCELIGGRFISSSEHNLALIGVDDGLKHRPQAQWTIAYMNSELSDSELWLKGALQDSDVDDVDFESARLPVEKSFCLSVATVSYGRNTAPSDGGKALVPMHQLVVYDLRGAWTKSNRNVAFALFDTFMKNKKMKKNLSTEALKNFWKDSTTPLKQQQRRPTDNSTTSANNTPNTAIHSLQGTSGATGSGATTESPMTRLQSGHAANMLQQLIAEADNNSIVYSDDLSTVNRQHHLQGLLACQQDDVIHKNWQIDLVNAQVLLKGCETKGYVILSAAKAEIVRRIHKPTWKDRTLVSKTTWTGVLECMQYYATVSEGENDALNENIMWLKVDNIQEKGAENATIIEEPVQLPFLVGSGVSVGAVVSDTVGPSTARQLQRIVSRCKCEFFYATYGDLQTHTVMLAPPPPPPDDMDMDLVGNRAGAASATDAFTLMHHDLEVCTNSLQYAMLLDIINNLLLYVEPYKKEALERLARMRFQLQLHSVEDQRRPIQAQQTIVRTTLRRLRRLEKDAYMILKALEEAPEEAELRAQSHRLEAQMYECKTQLTAQSEELDMMLSCYKESQYLAHSRLATTRRDKAQTVVRANEICFKHAQWRLTEADGQIGIADLVLSNFLYTKNSKSDDSVEHLLELGYLRMTNLIPNEIYKEVICPTEIQYGMPIEHKTVLRIFCRERPPVGGISVKEHFEINLVPLTIGLTKKFFNTMMKFCFPERDVADSMEYSTDDTASNVDVSLTDNANAATGKKSKKSAKNRDSNFYVHITDDVEKMKLRAEKNKLFVYIKIPEVPVKVSYKGTKEKNLEDLREVALVIPTLEYHNMTWTWLDLLVAVRHDTKRVILSQAIKQKLQIKRSTIGGGVGGAVGGAAAEEANSGPQEEDKARMLFGARHAPENKSIRKGVFKFK